MKDALGHGSNGSGDGTLLEALRARLSHSTILKGGGIPAASNHDAVVAHTPPTPLKMGGASAVREFRGTGVKDWSDHPIGDLKGSKGH